MPRFLYISLLTLALVIGVAGVAPATNAQGTVPIGGSCPNGDSDCISGVCGGGNQCAAAEASEPATPAETSTKDAENTGQGNQTTAPIIPDETGALGGVMVFLMGIFAWLLGVAAITLDNAVYYTVITMGDYVSKLSAVGVTWRILRDISNIALIFGFLAIGISTILNSERFGYGTKMLPSLVLAAVFLNFSLFFTEAIIDGGNLFATQFYTQINGGMPAKPINPLNPKEIVNEGISQKIMSQLKLQTIYSNALTNNGVLKAGNTALIGFMSIILFIVTAFVMFSLAFILIARFIILIFLIILAPIGVAGFAIPQLGGASKQWRDELIKQTITAPVLLLMLYIALAVITDAQFLGFGSTGDWTGFVEDNGSMNLAGFASSILSFLVAMGLLLAVVVFAGKLSKLGTSGAIKLAGKATFGATAFGTSALVNSGALGARRALQRYAPNSRTARVASNYLLRPIEKARMDVRSLPGVGAGLALGGAGEAAKPIAKSALGSVRQGSELLRKTTQESNRQYDQETHIPRLRAAIANNDQKAIGSLVNNMGDKELESSQMQALIGNNPSVAAVLSKNRFDKLLTSEVLTDAQKENLKKQRTAGLTARYTEGGGQEVTKLSSEAISQLPDDVLTAKIEVPEGQPADAVYKHLDMKQLNAILKADKIKAETATTIGTFLSGNKDFVAYFGGRNPDQQQDLNTFWHMSLPITANRIAGGATPPPPPGFQRNPGGNIFVPSGGIPNLQPPVTHSPTL